ncbi:unnamed protein product [Schistosoma curassoni]|uniref:Uncharacterized protein n=1 Tax=Schistosoma curassoni TaxID=6186 RepID=A0A183K6A9_9TREM|nr:unnamed protein product [Schistosoma curassoni]
MKLWKTEPVSRMVCIVLLHMALMTSVYLFMTFAKFRMLLQNSLLIYLLV